MSLDESKSGTCMTGDFGKEGRDNILQTQCEELGPFPLLDSSSVAKNADYRPQNFTACLIGKMGFGQKWRLKICSLVAHLSYLGISSCWIWDTSIFIFCISFFFLLRLCCIARLSFVWEDWEHSSLMKFYVIETESSFLYCESCRNKTLDRQSSEEEGNGSRWAGAVKSESWKISSGCKEDKFFLTIYFFYIGSSLIVTAP